MLNRREALKGAVAAIGLIGLPPVQTTAFAITPSKTVKGVFVSNDAFVPEQWARDSLAILEENMVVANLVHRDFDVDTENKRIRLKDTPANGVTLEELYSFLKHEWEPK